MPVPFRLLTRFPSLLRLYSAASRISLFFFSSLFRHSGKYILLVGARAANEVVDVEAALKSPE